MTTDDIKLELIKELIKRKIIFNHLGGAFIGCLIVHEWASYKDRDPDIFNPDDFMGSIKVSKVIHSKVRMAQISDEINIEYDETGTGYYEEEDGDWVDKPTWTLDEVTLNIKSLAENNNDSQCIPSHNWVRLATDEEIKTFIVENTNIKEPTMKQFICSHCKGVYETETPFETDERMLCAKCVLLAIINKEVK